MFKKKETYTHEEYQEAQDTIKTLREESREMEAIHRRSTEDLEHKHKLELKDKDFQLAHQESEKLKQADSKIKTLEQDLAVQKQKNEMLDKIVDLNSDIIDVKDLVNKLIEKLPNIDITSLSVQGKNK